MDSKADIYDQISELDENDSDVFPLTYNLFAKLMVRAEAEFKLAERRFRSLEEGWLELQRRRGEDDWRYEQTDNWIVEKDREKSFLGSLSSEQLAEAENATKTLSEKLLRNQ